MTKEQIIRMANDAGIDCDADGDIWGSTNGSLERFAALVAAAEREKVQAELNKLETTQCSYTWRDSPPCRGISRAIEAEREAIMEICNRHSHPVAGVIHHAIQARGEK